ncbi:hypothetical protein [Nocardia panacis]|uniref:hypothetical protein n=1 Tax=Nocardia panacis TaxID=2340916 RepID=UPI0013153178|nr:hypothetical protein [Nocardia panacis]
MTTRAPAEHCRNTWKRLRVLRATFSNSLGIRHGSPCPRLLFEPAVAGGVTSFEDFRLFDSIAVRRHVDRRTAEFADRGIRLDRELFGTRERFLPAGVI